MKALTTALIAALFISSGVHAETKKEVTDLPDISVIGNFVATHSDDAKSFDVSEIEFSFQNYLYPSVRADIFAALHKENGVHSMALEEGYVTFLDLYGLMMPNSKKNLGIGAIAGKKLIGFGKINPLHPEQQQFVDRPMATQQFLGGAEGLAAEGAQLSYLLPLPFFSQIEAGYWTVAAHAEEEEEGAHGVEFSNKLISARLWNGFALSDSNEVELGLSMVQGNATADSSDDKQDVIGVDLSMTKELSKGRSLKLQTEYYQATYGEEGESRESQSGGYATAVYTINPFYQAGLRYGMLGKHGDEGEEQNSLALMLTKQLTETSKFRLQYNMKDDVDGVLYAQFIFGMGPHAHVLQ